MGGQPIPDELWIDWLGLERAKAFKKVSTNALMQDLVLANQKISAAIFEDCSYVEVALRNRLSAGMQRRLERISSSASWLEDPTGELQTIDGGRFFKQIQDARRRAMGAKSCADESDIVAELSLGFWIGLLSKKSQKLRIDLIGNLPGYQSRSMNQLMNGLNEFRNLRNRVAHHHGVLHRDIQRDAQSVLLIASWIDPVLRDFVAANSRIEALRGESGFLTRLG